MHILVEAFLADEVAFRGDILEVLEEHRDEFIDWRRARRPCEALLVKRCGPRTRPAPRRPNWSLFVFLVKQLFPSTSSSHKNVKATKKEIAEHYDRGNDFFAAFLGARRRRPRNSGGAQFGRRQRSSSGAQFGLSAVHSLRLTSAAAAPPCAQARR